MGYSITLWSSDLSIPKENWDAAFNAVCELNEHDELKTGGDGTNVWFAWMDANYPEQALHDWEQLRSPHPLVFVLQQLGFDWELGTDECLCLTHYDSKSGAE